MCFTSFKQFFWLTHPQLHTAFSGLTQWPTFVQCVASTHTAAVPSGIPTRFPILLRCCYHIRKHLNGIFTSRKVYTMKLRLSITKRNNCIVTSEKRIFTNNFRQDGWIYLTVVFSACLQQMQKSLLHYEQMCDIVALHHLQGAVVGILAFHRGRCNAPKQSRIFDNFIARAGKCVPARQSTIPYSRSDVMIRWKEEQ